jgi:hypothetical protein
MLPNNPNDGQVAAPEKLPAAVSWPVEPRTLS